MPAMNKNCIDLWFSEGFTLVELVVVILLLGVLAAVATPKFFNLDDYRTRAAYDEVAGALRYAQKLAVASGCEVQVILSGNSYTLQQHSTDCASGTFSTITNHPVTSNTISGVSISSTPGSFIFDAMGRSSSAVTVNIGSSSFNLIAETGYVDAQ
ncbi:MAG: prepilin-type N-terminal cleavage/methylation domain-containing protein [Deltaproteobacteria bacterium]|jgi:MSHA pilin protein MshC|nr:prepilin-type N-terminal cleavage/methylation domain-containing protein [Deltaproteobacteria bacterium]MCW8892172.1 prepilin-type N-terminal cleavage/methylation domain-containing protein [Deltaproteobacteria bacterium]MCW9050588.1 prepilin-type N-terminal cleavage/methylation domain-containing protein [Deltaproteobacteria bacterium]